MAIRKQMECEDKMKLKLTQAEDGTGGAPIQKLLFGLAMASAMAMPTAAQNTNVRDGLVITGVTVVDVHTGKETSNQTVVVSGGKIVRIAPSGKVNAKAPAQIVDGRGKFVVPGYWDMHAHPLDGDRAQNLAVMLAYGITGVRQMSGSDAELAERKAGTLIPSVDSPEILIMPGTILTRQNAGTPEAALKEIQKQKAEGADFIKIVDTNPPAFFAAIADAKSVDLPIAGHLAPGVDPAKASIAGMRAIEHLGPGETILDACSSDEEAIVAGVAKRPPPTPQNMPPSAMAEMARNAVMNPTLSRVVADPTFFTRMQHALDTFSEEKCRKLAQVFVDHNTWQAVTLIRLRTAQLGDDPVYRHDPNLQYMSPAIVRAWQKNADVFASKMTPDGRATLQQLDALQLRITKLFDQAGVRLLAGSDMGGIWVIPGASLHQEFDLLGQAGLTPLRVLQMTTSNGAEFLGRQQTAGAVEEGKNADLVLLSADPIASVQNLHALAGVVRNGKYYSKEDMDNLKTKAATALRDGDAKIAPDGKAAP